MVALSDAHVSSRLSYRDLLHRLADIAGSFCVPLFSTNPATGRVLLRRLVPRARP